MDDCIAGRRMKQFNCAKERWPTFPQDVEKYGEPWKYYPIPTWRLWKLDVWWYFASPMSYRIAAAYNPGWSIQETYWMSEMHELIEIYKRMYKTVGLYTHVQLMLSISTWDYLIQTWADHDHVKIMRYKLILVCL